jgi:hypothetical protein
MEGITFCIPFYGKELAHTELLKTCVEQIRKYYPANKILVCKTSDSYMPDLSGIDVYDTFVDGSHIIGAIEILMRKCTTKHYLIMHDSMFLLKPLPESVLDKPLYGLWHFHEQSRYFYSNEISPMIRALRLPAEERSRLDELFRSNPQKEWNGIFGPAFGGSLEVLRTLWSILNVTPANIGPYLGRTGLMASERVIGIIFIYMGIKVTYSLNGNIYGHPKVFEVSTIPDFDTIKSDWPFYSSYVYKIWKKRDN